MMEQEVVEIEILYFDKTYFEKYFNDWKNGLKVISPFEQSWNYFFKLKKENHEILEVLKYKDLKFLLLEDDILWYEAIPNFKDGEFTYITEYSRLISLRSLRLVKPYFYNNLFDIDQNWSHEIEELYKILDRNDKLKKLDI